MGAGKSRYSLSDYIQGITHHERRILAKALSLLESSREEDKPLLYELLDYCYAYFGKAIRVGITGSPGAGKSTFLEHFVTFLLEEEPGSRVAVIAVDPSSVRSGGSIMGDAIRMERLAMHDRAYIRAVPSRGQLGGIAPSTLAMCMLFDAAGYDWIFIETVGVGQNEIRITEVADLYFLLIPPASGDDIQGLKRGIMEIADLILITKADGPYETLAKQTQAAYSQALRLFGTNVDGIQAQVLTISSVEQKGFQKLKVKLTDLITEMKKKGILIQRRERQIAHFIQEQLRIEAMELILQHPRVQKTYTQLMQEMKTFKRAPHSVVHSLIQEIQHLMMEIDKK